LLELKDEAAKSSDPLRLSGPGEYECKSKIELPKGYTPGLLPAADIVRDFAEYHSSYSFKDGVFEAERRLIIKIRELPSSRRSDYTSLQKAVAEEGSLFTSLSMGTGDLRAQADQMSADELNTAAANLIDQKKDFSLARDLLLKATLKNPNHKWAWNNLGRAYASLGSPEEAVKAYKKQIEIDPNDEYAYKNLGWTYSGMRRYDDAAAAYRKHLEINPGDKDVYGYLGWTLGEMEKWGEAAQAYEKSAALNPDQPYSYTQWARALMKSGKTDDARKQLDRALELDSGPVTLNNVAWERADAGVDLDQAEEEAKSAVDKTASDLGGPLSLDIPADYSRRLSALGAYLDTLGWVLFQKGNLDEADPYLLSAYQLQSNSLVAEHVARLRARQDKFEEAVRYYAYSQAAMDWTGYADKELEDYVTKKSGGTGPLMSRVMELKGAFRDQHNLTAPGGPFTWPENSSATKAAFAQVAVVVDAAGVVTDAQILSGDDSSKDTALTDARKLRLPAITWPGRALPTVRTISFLYKPRSAKSSEKRVKVVWTMGKPPAGYVTMITPDGDHVVSAPASLIPFLAARGATNVASDSAAGSTQPSVPDYLGAIQEGEILRRERDLDGAISRFRQAIQAEPNCAMCHRVLADTLAQKGYRALAVAEYQEVARIEPDNPENHFMLGAQLEAAGATKLYSDYHFDSKSRTNRPSGSTLPKSARADYEFALEQYRLAHELAPGDKSYKEAYERIERQLKHP
jgi:tetratricopeptide (TPR) repeat protein